MARNDRRIQARWAWREWPLNTAWRGGPSPPSQRQGIFSTLGSNHRLGGFPTDPTSGRP
jgi:hypothetical protein